MTVAQYSYKGSDENGYIVVGPGLTGRHDVPTFKTLGEVETACRCFLLAFEAGMYFRSGQFRELLLKQGGIDFP